MNGITTFALEILASLALSAIVLARLQGRLERVCPEVHKRPGGADFWVAYTQLMMFIAPLLLIAFFSRAGNTAPLSGVAQMKCSLLLLLAGQFVGLVFMGRAVWKSIPKDPTPSWTQPAPEKGAAS